MAHEITIRENGYAEMAFVGGTPWHGLGQELQADADMDAWRVAAGMDWTIEQAKVEYRAAGIGNMNYDGRFVQYRSDNGMPLSVVSERYKPVQPHEVLSFFDELVKEAGFRLHTAGTLFGGKRMWALAETGRFGEVSKDDGVGGFLLLSTSADKSLATTARFTTVRVVCNNTLSLAARDKSDCVSFTHSRAFDHELIKRKLGTAVESFGAFMEMAQHLRKQRVTQDAASAFVRRLVLTNEQLVDQDYNYQKNRAYAKIINLFNGEARGAELVGDSKWGLLNAVTEYYDHHMPARTPDARLNNAWFGNGEANKEAMVNMLLAA